ncbi:hypothetical protein MAR_ORF047 [Marseillevirus marseillevirus]|uniref:Uncharacterized protein n=1 Tax=Marseillevirus marseillevirus TaxID=694581 RepID=D2XA58_GBMV|nr:hypothetical protein MAR_ORF047 [Marseillevirus marseillevirus]ADB03835.1 hypothetical protein MAR_ORF047 [Marseillevirus marseillevirus]
MSENSELAAEDNFEAPPKNQEQKPQIERVRNGLGPRVQRLFFRRKAPRYYDDIVLWTSLKSRLSRMHKEQEASKEMGKREGVEKSGRGERGIIFFCF